MSQDVLTSSSGQSQVLNEVRQEAASNEVYFVDSSLDAEALALTIGDDSRIFVIENTSNAFLQMEQALASLENPATAVHIYAHGAAGSVTLGGQVFDEAALNANAATLAAIGQSLAAGADLLLYSCNTAAGSTGESFINRLARLASVDVAASDDVTGASGDWTLEYTVGDVTTGAVNPGIDGDLADGDSISGWGVINAQSTLIPSPAPLPTTKSTATAARIPWSARTATTFTTSADRAPPALRWWKKPTKALIRSTARWRIWT